jgi:hypothetical protein
MFSLSILEAEPILRAFKTILALGPTTLVICASKADFYSAVLNDLTNDSTTNHTDDDTDDHTIDYTDGYMNDNSFGLSPTLENLERSSRLKVYFCDTLAILHGRLSTLDEPRPLVLLYPLALHLTLSAHSAQALNRTIAAAVDAACRLDVELFLLEPGSKTDQDPWNQNLPILSATSRFGVERGWVGRTVTARQVVQRWMEA